MRRGSHRWLSPTLFAIAALAFLLPFATVSCDDAKTSFTGIELVTYSVPHGGAIPRSEGPDADGSKCTVDISSCVERRGSALARAAVVVALLGLAIGVGGFQRAPGFFGVAGLAALIRLATINTNADVTLHSGYWLMMLTFAWTSVLHARRTWRRWGIGLWTLLCSMLVVMDFIEETFGPAPGLGSLLDHFFVILIVWAVGLAIGVGMTLLGRAILKGQPL
jgi:hypothetical protein